MKAALVSEYRKLVSTRMWWILLLVFVGYMLFLAAVFGWSLSFAADQAAEAGQEGGIFSPQQLAQTIYGLAMSLGYVFPVIVGALSVTSEFRHQTITPTLLAEPRRSVVLGAKLLASLPVGLFFGLLGTLATAGTGAAVLALTGNETYLDEWVVQRSILLSVVGLAVWAAVGVGLGATMPNQVVAIVVLLAFTQFVEPTVRVVAGFVGWLQNVTQFFPGAAGDALIGASFYASMGGASGTLLEWWQGLLVLLGYAVLFAVIGRVTTFRRDIT